MMDIVKLLREAGDVYHDIARDMLQNEWKEHLAPHYTQRGDELKLAADELERDAERDIIVDDLIIQRDYWEERATELAERVGEHFGFDVGEHSSMNCPVLNALESKWTDPPTERAVPEITGDTSDGYHTFNELYEFRKVYNAALFNEWAAAGKHDVHKSWRHHDGEKCFGGGWFIVVAVLPAGQISNHYAAEDWGLFNAPECERAKFEFDGHTSEDVLLRLKTLAAAPGAGGE